ncbi:hypothetical protein [Amycolatopsis anabasis]|uniref:hypothetical protein n=1 Tax=Amycolatopsis anabasis TaxID=1840409 RepID=UPI00131E6932|nr:hypothetical protein [Amycolatopsis anabasis]
MSWTEYVDGYCERVAPGFWGEPLNAVSNLAFLVATVAIWRLGRNSPGPVRALGPLVGLVFAASTAFHTFATRWGAAADTGFILVFVLYYAVCFTRVFLGVRWRFAWLAAPLFTAFAVPVAYAGGGYLPALLGLFGLAAILAARRDPDWSRFAVVGGIFAVSLSLRTADHAVCGHLPIGTHFLWHLLNGCVLYLVSRAAILRAGSAESPRPPAFPRPSAPGSPPA